MVLAGDNGLFLLSLVCTGEGWIVGAAPMDEGRSDDDDGDDDDEVACEEDGESCSRSRYSEDTFAAGDW